MKKVVCSVCLQDDYQKWHQVGEYTLVKCSRCGFVYVNPRPTEEELKETYSEDYYQRSGSYERSGEQDWERKTAYFETIMQIIKRFLKKGHLLEIGCAFGYFLDVASRHGFVVEGVEFSQWSGNSARENRGFKVFIGNMLEAKYPDQHFNLVAAWEVLEHVVNPREYLEEIRRILKPGGLLAFSVPNIRSLIGYFKNDEELMPHFHLSHFSPVTIKKFLEQFGFRIKHLKTVPVTSWKSYLNYIAVKAGISISQLKEDPRILARLWKTIPALIWAILGIRLLGGILDGIFSLTNRMDRMIVIAQLKAEQCE